MFQFELNGLHLYGIRYQSTAPSDLTSFASRIVQRQPLSALTTLRFLALLDVLHKYASHPFFLPAIRRSRPVCLPQGPSPS